MFFAVALETSSCSRTSSTYNKLLDWLLFFLKGVEQTAKHSIEILNDALDLKTNLTQTIRGNTGNRANNNLRFHCIKINLFNDISKRHTGILFKMPFVVCWVIIIHILEMVFLISSSKA
jgi:Fic family protein